MAKCRKKVHILINYPLDKNVRSNCLEAYRKAKYSSKCDIIIFWAALRLIKKDKNSPVWNT